jgi:hypothetical protein
MSVPAGVTITVLETAALPTAYLGPAAPRSGAFGGPPHPHHPVLAAADDDWGAIRQPPGRRRMRCSPVSAGIYARPQAQGTSGSAALRILSTEG